MTTEQDIRNQIEYSRYEGLAKGREEGRREGLAKGREEGRDAERLVLARKMLDAGIACEQVISITGLPEEEIRNL